MILFSRHAKSEISAVQELFSSADKGSFVSKVDSDLELSRMGLKDMDGSNVPQDSTTCGEHQPAAEGQTMDEEGEPERRMCGGCQKPKGREGFVADEWQKANAWSRVAARRCKECAEMEGGQNRS